MRGLASIFLVFQHYFFHCKYHGLFHFIAGTSIFYFISGFVIPMSFERNSLKQWLVKRFFRLYPVILFILGTSLCITLFIKGEHTIRGIDINVKNIFLNLTFTPHLFLHNNDSLHRYLYIATTWTICVDFTFYFLLIIAYKIFKKPKCRINFVVVFTLISLVVVKILHKKFHIYGAMLETLTCLMPFYFGMASYYYSKNYITKKHFLITALCIFAPLFFHNRYCKYIVGGLLMLYLFTYHKELGNNKIVRFFAHISYPMFLVHSIVPILIWSYASNCLANGLSRGYFFVLYPAMIPICYFIYRFIEKPCNEFGRKIAAKLR